MLITSVVITLYFIFRLEHEKLHAKHKGHEAMHMEMVLILFSTLIVAQVLLVKWKKHYYKSFQVINCVQINCSWPNWSMFTNNIFITRNSFHYICLPLCPEVIWMAVEHLSLMSYFNVQKWCEKVCSSTKMSLKSVTKEMSNKKQNWHSLSFLSSKFVLTIINNEIQFSLSQRLALKVFYH